MRWLLAALVLAPLAAGAISSQHAVQVQAANQAAFAVLSSGDQGSATVGASGTAASVSVADGAILVADDILDITSTDSSWQVRAQYLSHTGFTGLTTSVTLSLRIGLSSASQITIANGAVTKATGTNMDLPTTQDTELTAATTLLASGSITFELIITKDNGTGPVLRYPVTVTVT